VALILNSFMRQPHTYYAPRSVSLQNGILRRQAMFDRNLRVTQSRSSEPSEKPCHKRTISGLNRLRSGLIASEWQRLFADNLPARQPPGTDASTIARPNPVWGPSAVTDLSATILVGMVIVAAPADVWRELNIIWRILNSAGSGNCLD
jgi:hypothetical protein